MSGSEEKRRINIDFEDMPDDDSSNKLVIDKDDLLSANESSEKEYPGINDAPANIHSKHISKFTPVSLWQLSLAGLTGGFLAWFLTEFPFAWERTVYREQIEILFNVSLFFSIIGGIIGAFLGAIEGLTSRVAIKTIKGIAVGLLVGFIGGAIGGLAGQFVYGELGGGQQESILLQILIRGFGWALVGLFIGLGQGLGTGGGRRILNGLIGGFIGGTIGGLLFDIIASIMMDDVASRAVAISILGLFSGLAIGLVQEMRKEAWLKAIEGATSGKEYIIHSDITTIGSSPKNDIVLVKDQDVSFYHAEITMTNNTYLITDLQDTGGVRVNGKRITRQRLKYGDMIHIGNYKLQYFEKASM